MRSCCVLSSADVFEIDVDALRQFFDLFQLRHLHFCHVQRAVAGHFPGRRHAGQVAVLINKGFDFEQGGQGIARLEHIVGHVHGDIVNKQFAGDDHGA